MSAGMLLLGLAVLMLSRVGAHARFSSILPEFVLTRWWEQLLHNQSALLLKARLLFRSNTVVVSVPYLIRGRQVDVTGDTDRSASLSDR